MGFAIPALAVGLGAGPKAVGADREMDAKKPQVGKADIAVTTLDRLLTKMRPVVIVGTILVICLAVYAMAWVLTKR
jgi:hypothetical protein